MAVYHLMTEEEGRNGFFRWNDHICMFIKNNWSRLLPYRKKTGSWQSTVAGVLSQYSPSVFKSGKRSILAMISLNVCVSLCRDCFAL